ncbi:MAG: hypothetical protein U0414_19255 [Polyangiaceae bacterium]
MADGWAALREADRLLGRATTSAALDARVSASLAERRPARVVRRGWVLAASLAALVVGLRALERRATTGIGPDADSAREAASAPDFSGAPRPIDSERSADDSAPSARPVAPRASDRSPRRVPPPEERRDHTPHSRRALPRSPRPDERVMEGPRFTYVPSASSDRVIHFERTSPRDDTSSLVALGGAPALRPYGIKAGPQGGAPTPSRRDDPELEDSPATPPPSEDDPSPLPEPTCESELVEPGACVALEELKMQASEALCADGLALISFDIDLGTCRDGLAAAAKYTCCPAEAAPPPDEKPPVEPDQPDTCKPLQVLAEVCVATAALDAEAGQQCGAGAVIVDHKYLGDCPDGFALEAWFTCCAVPMKSEQDG